MANWPYSTQRWQRLRKAKLAEDPLCRACLERGVTTPAEQVDHVLAIAQGGDAWEWSNVQSLCASCHSRKTSHVEVHGHDHAHIPGCDIHGMPLCPCHPWHRR